MIVVKNLSKGYTTSVDNKLVINDVSMEFPDTGLCFLIGESGSGKSTLINLLGGIIDEYTGQVIVNGIDISNLSETEWDNFRNSSYGVIYQDFNLIETESVYYNLMLPLDIIICEDKNRDSRIDEVLTYVGLLEYKYQKVCRLSGGQKQRIAIARALIKNPNIILADEPTGNLDSEASKNVFELLKKMSRKCLVIIASHDQAAAYEYGDMVYEISDGVIRSTISSGSDYQYMFECNNETVSSGRLSINRIVRCLTESINQHVFSKKVQDIKFQLNISLSDVSSSDDSTNEKQICNVKHQIETCELSKGNALKYAMQGIKNKYIRNTFMVLLVAIIIAFQIFSINFINFNSAIPIEKYYNEYPPRYLTLNKKIAYTDSFLNYQEVVLTSGNVFYSSLSNVFDEKYICPVIKDASINKDDYAFDNIRVVVSDMNVSDDNDLLAGRYPKSSDEVVITDYLLKRLGLSLDDYNNEEVELYGKTMKLVGILETDYIEYDIINKIATSYVNEYCDYKVYNQYLITVVDSSFIETMRDETEVLSILGGNILYSQWESRLVHLQMSYGSLESLSSSVLLCGELPQKSNDIVISESVSMNMNIDIENFNPINGSFLDIHSESYCDAYSSILNMHDLFIDGYRIVGVYDSKKIGISEPAEVLVDDGIFSKLKSNYFDTYMYGEYYVIPADVDYSTFEMLNEENIKWTDVSAKKIYDFTDTLNKLEPYFIFASILLFIGLIVSCILLIGYSIKDQSKILGIMKTIGYTKSDLNKIFIVESIVVGITSAIASSLLFLMTTYWVNIRYARELPEFKFDLLVFSPMYTWVILVISMVVFIISSSIPIYKLTQHKPFDLIHFKGNVS